ncbi:Ig-like domain-containing protein, partial [Alteromonas sp. KUL106]|uniref:Ig-like domain-containing protein n=1 Tax=Alteromonas sp. KUL106 TaxID=2480799 RepID=UPI0013596326
VVVTQPSNGTLSGSEASQTYTPNADFYGTDTFTFKVNDGTEDSDIGTVTITVTPANDAPTVESFSVITDEATPKDIVLIGEDKDEDGLNYEVTVQPSNGSIICDDQFCIYTPNDEFDGTDSFKYIARDEELSSEPGIVTIVVNDTIQDNLPPVAVNDELALSSLEQAQIDVLANDYDPEGEQLTLTYAYSTFGSVSIVDNEILFVPPSGFKGLVMVPYTIEDDQQQVATATLYVAVDVELSDDLPIIEVPADLCGPLSVAANALYTRVNYGEARAYDQYGNVLPVSVIDNITHFAPGNNVVYWQATDARGNRSVAAQRVCVDPLISIGKDQAIVEGETLKIGVFLNGDSPTYPVEVAYTISGTSDLQDHNLVDGVLVIESGTRGYIQTETFEDAATEGDETIIITLDNQLNRGAKFIHETTLSEGNLAPEVTLTVKQADESRLTVTQGGGIVSINADIYDPNLNDTFDISWFANDSEIENLSSAENRFDFDPSTLASGVYKVSIRVTDSGLPMGDDDEFVFINVIPMLIALGAEDSDGDNIPDNIEGYQDIDKDGIPDYMDRIDECNVLYQEQFKQDGYLIEGDPSACLRIGSVALQSEFGGSFISDNDVERNVGGLIKDSEARNIGGIFDFIAHSLPEESQSIAVVLPQKNPIPKNAIYRKYHRAKGWNNFVEDDKNSLWSVAGEPGYCPPPRSEGWQPGLVEGHWCVQIEIEDGGPNDDDGQVNGVVEDPGYVGIWETSNAAPIAQDTVLTTEFNEQVDVDLSELISDEDNDALEITSVTTEIGGYALNGYWMTYIPQSDFSGISSVTYGVSDGNGGTSFGVVTINVLPPNYAPIPGEIIHNALRQCDDSALVDVLSVATDPENDVVSVIEAASQHGVVTILNNGDLMFTPSCDFFGTATIDYTLQDTAGNQTTARFTITVKQVVEVIAVTESSGGAWSCWSILGLAFMTLIRRLSMRKVIAIFVLFFMSTYTYANQERQGTERNQQGSEAKENEDWPLGWFMEGSVGLSETDVSTSDLDKAYQVAGIEAQSVAIKNDDMSYSVNIGYQFNTYFAITYGYQDLGERNVSFTGSVLSEDLTRFFDAAEEVYPQTAEGQILSAIFSIPLSSQFKFDVRLGYSQWDRDYVTTENGVRGRASDSENDWVYGIGVSYVQSESLVWRLEYDFRELQTQDVTNLSLSLRYFPFQ